MTHTKSRELRLKNRPEGLPGENDFELVELEVPEPAEGEVLVQNIYMQGFIVMDHFDKMQQFYSDMAKWIADNRIKWKETVVDGLENAPGAFIGLFKGENFGKMIVRIGNTKKYPSL